MKVLLVDPSGYTPYYDYSLCTALRQAGCHVEWITSPFLYDELPNPSNLPVRYLFFRACRLPFISRIPLTSTKGLRKVLKALEYPFDLPSLFRHVKTLRPDVVHFQWVMVPPLDAVMFQCLKTWGARVVYTVHEPPSHGAGPWRQKVYNALYRSADQLIVPSHWGKRVLTEGPGLDPAKVHVIPLGNLEDFRGPAVNRGKAREALGIRPRERTALFFGRLTPDKGLDVLIRAFSQVKARLPEARLLIAANPLESFSQYERLIAHLGLTSDITVRLGFIPQGELAIYFGAADVVILPYLRAYHSANLLTAYTFGRPVVTTAVGGLPEDIVEGQSGHVVPPGDEEALAQAICTLLADDEKLGQMGRYARHLAETRYAWPRIAQATLAVYMGGEGLR